jgi:predicted site-specific integrase-resolvase
MNKPAAIYARVSSDRQKENQTIASQTAALTEYAESHGYLVPAAWVFEDDGYSGASLIRPGLEALRDLAAQGQIKAALVYSPDRLSRRYAFCCRQQGQRDSTAIVVPHARVASSHAEQPYKMGWPFWSRGAKRTVPSAGIEYVKVL